MVDSVLWGTYCLCMSRRSDEHGCYKRETRMLLTADSRNQCAHPKLQTKEFAKKARVTVFDKGETITKTTSDGIYELIFELFGLMQ